MSCLEERSRDKKVPLGEAGWWIVRCWASGTREKVKLKAKWTRGENRRVPRVSTGLRCT